MLLFRDYESVATFRKQLLPGIRLCGGVGRHSRELHVDNFMQCPYNRITYVRQFFIIFTSMNKLMIAFLTPWKTQILVAVSTNKAMPNVEKAGRDLWAGPFRAGFSSCLPKSCNSDHAFLVIFTTIESRQVLYPPSFEQGENGTRGTHGLISMTFDQ